MTSIATGLSVSLRKHGATRIFRDNEDLAMFAPLPRTGSSVCGVFRASIIETLHDVIDNLPPRAQRSGWVEDALREALSRAQSSPQGGIVSASHYAEMVFDVGRGYPQAQCGFWRRGNLEVTSGMTIRAGRDLLMSASYTKTGELVIESDLVDADVRAILDSVLRHELFDPNNALWAIAVDLKEQMA